MGGRRVGAQNFVLSSLSRHNFHYVFPLLGVFSWNCRFKALPPLTHSLDRAPSSSRPFAGPRSPSLLASLGRLLLLAELLPSPSPSQPPSLHCWTPSPPHWTTHRLFVDPHPLPAHFGHLPHPKKCQRDLGIWVSRTLHRGGRGARERSHEVARNQTLCWLWGCPRFPVQCRWPQVSGFRFQVSGCGA